MEKLNEPRCWTCGAEAVAVTARGVNACALCVEAERQAVEQMRRAIDAKSATSSRAAA